MLRRCVVRYNRIVPVLVVCFTIYTLLPGKYSILGPASKRNGSASRKDKTNGTWYTNGLVATTTYRNGPVTANKRELFQALLPVKIPGNDSVINERKPFTQQDVKTSNETPAHPYISNNKPIRKSLMSNLTTIFSDDYVPDAYATMLMDNSTIHFCQIVAKTEYALEVEMLVRSVLLHARRSDVFFHFIATEGAEKALPKIFETITHAFVDVKYEVVEIPHLTAYLNDKFENKVTFTHPWSGIYGTGKIFMYDLLPHVNTCIVIDSDTLFGIDPAFLWNEAKLHLRPPVTLAATWAPTPEHFNSGVMVHDLERMRKIDFSHFITMKGCKVVQYNGKTTFRCEHDQQLLLQMLNDHRELFYLLSVSWNLDKCSSFKKLMFDSFSDKLSGFFFGVVHFCCFPTELKYAYERGTRYMNNIGLVNYFNYLKGLDFNRLGARNVFRVMT